MLADPALGYLFVAMATFGGVAAADQPATDSDQESEFRFRFVADAGKSWTNMGPPKSGRIGRIIVPPLNPDIVFACVLGRVTGPQQERGVFRTTDGGQHWARVLLAGENVGCSGLSLDPHNPYTLIAGMWQVAHANLVPLLGRAGTL
jgi:hypothetical protein